MSEAATGGAAAAGFAPRILLVVGGGIAAYKACELVRLIRKGGGDVTCVLTRGGQQFVTPMSLAALSENQVYTNLFDLKNEAEMGHIQLSREADLVVVCPATADLLAKMAAGIADDLATTLILATDKPVMAVPAMNVRMWEHEATQRNIGVLKAAGVSVLHPDKGAMACGEFGYGRLPEPEVIWREIAAHFGVVVPEVQVAAPVRGIEVEALEPEEEDDAAAAMPEGGLSGFFSRIIPRSTPKRTHEEIEAEYEDLPEELPEDFLPEDFPPEEPVPEFKPDFGGPLLARKGSAGAAPPMDTGALNHLIDPRKAPPLPGAPAVPDEIETVLGEVPDGADFGHAPTHRPLLGRHVLVTAGPTWEAIDPVRYIANRSSGKQGFAIAAAAAALGARVTLVAGPVSLKTPAGVNRIDVESAHDMQQAVRRSLPADVAVMVAAVADWRPRDYRNRKIKKRESAPPVLMLTENPDILINLSAGTQRPGLVIG
ncbi:MAG: bifunctional phosphopantothenoylcysteine decarboxylase/phosphopantothenate synthase, partial [Porphyrobacter sp.]|nr:bifunctional phosphopantothenoylcysteine decarboxylase/phosphopantothenate synthase [Porphyrobacter sp.]